MAQQTITSERSMLKASVTSFVRHQQNLNLSDRELIDSTVNKFEGMSSKSDLTREVAKAVAYHRSKDLNAFIDLDESTSFMITINVKGNQFAISLHTLLAEITKQTDEG